MTCGKVAHSKQQVGLVSKNVEIQIQSCSLRWNDPISSWWQLFDVSEAISTKAVHYSDMKSA